jgi:hypothetical protein
LSERERERDDQKFPFKLETLSSALSVFPAREVVEAAMFLSFTSVGSLERNFTRIQNTEYRLEYQISEKKKKD